MGSVEQKTGRESLGLSEVDTYIFDYGGVVSFHYCEPYQSNISHLLRVDPKIADELLSETSPQGKAYREGKMTRDTFWEEVIRLAGADNVTASELEDNWARSYQIDQRMLHMIARLRNERGFQIGIMMNTDVYRHNHIEQEYQLSSKVDFIISSFQTGVTKPNPEAYHLALVHANRLNTPGKVIYIDDKQRNIVPCFLVGMKGFIFKSFEDLRDTLQNESVLNFERSNL
jgi:HAD superfamily hydrolase (TIGR01509 family)